VAEINAAVRTSPVQKNEQQRQRPDGGVTVPMHVFGTVIVSPPGGCMPNGIPFRSRHGLHWQIVLIDPRLLYAVQRRLNATGPSHTIEEALRIAIGERPHVRGERRSVPRGPLQ
jgi:hypothetical protein